MIHLWASFGFLLVGTMVLTKKKARTANDFPFHKLPTMALKELPRGWSRQATQDFHTDKHGIFVAQATVWKDRKEVGFLHNYKVEPGHNPNSTVLRYSSPDKCRISINVPAVVAEYSANMGGVDRKDRDSADYTTSIRTSRYYLRIFFGFWMA